MSTLKPLIPVQQNYYYISLIAKYILVRPASIISQKTYTIPSYSKPMGLGTRSDLASIRQPMVSSQCGTPLGEYATSRICAKSWEIFQRLLDLRGVRSSRTASRFMPASRHFWKRQNWHWLRVCLLTTHCWYSRHLYCRSFCTVRLKKPLQPSQL